MRIASLMIIAILTTCWGISNGQANKSGANLLESKIRQARTATDKANALTKAALNLVNQSAPTAADLSKALSYANEGLALGHRINYAKGEGAGYIAILQILKKQGASDQKAKTRQQALNFFKDHPYPVDEIDALLATGNYYNPKIFEDLDQKIALYEKVVEFMKITSPGSLKLALALRNLGNLHMYVRKDEPMAVTELKESLTIYKANGHEQLQDIYGLLTGLLSDLEDFRQALKYGLLAVNTIERFRDSSQTALAVYDNLGTLYYGINDYDNGVKYLIEGLSLAKKTKNVAFIYDISHDLSTTYFRLHRSEKAISNLLYALKLASKVDIPRQCLVMADLLSAHGNQTIFICTAIRHSAI